MSWWHPHNFEAKRETLQKRAQIIAEIRSFFDGEGFSAVETPALQIMAAPDIHIHAFETDHLGVDLKVKQRFGLHTSPEIAMKKLLVAGMKKIYQICPVFRNAEDSSLHSGEFTMIEWYRTNSDYTAMMHDCESLISTICQKTGVETLQHKNMICDPFKTWQTLSVCEAFQSYAEIDLAAYLDDTAGFAKAITERGIRVAEDDAWDDLFFRVMAEKIEPYLGKDVPTMLCDYPLCMASLARKCPDDPRFAQRFELYICGVEIANAFSELCDVGEQRARFEADMAEKTRIYGGSNPIDEEFLSALECGMPESSGIALGIDRLVMVMTGADMIDDVLWCEKV